MSDALKNVRNSINIFDENLIVGDHDSITLFGTQSQIKLRDYSRVIAHILLKDNDDLESALKNTVSEIDEFQKQTQSRQHNFWKFPILQNEIAREYGKMIKNIDKTCTCLKLQHAQLLKEIKYLEKLSASILENINSLSHYIEIGQETLNAKLADRAMREQNNLQSDCPLVDDTDNWYKRLDRRISDLKISHTLALQNQAQIKILYENDLLLIDRISTAISNTIPLWQNQMIIVLGTTKLNKRISEQNRIFRNSAKQRENIDMKKIAELTEQIKNFLSETITLEAEGTNVRKEVLSLNEMGKKERRQDYGKI